MWIADVEGLRAELLRVEKELKLDSLSEEVLAVLEKERKDIVANLREMEGKLWTLPQK